MKGIHEIAEGEGWALARGSAEFLPSLLDGEKADAVITDPPYSAKTHGGQHEDREEIGYAAWGEDTARAYAGRFAEWCRGWVVILSDHILAPHYAEALERAGRYVFAPLPIVMTGSTVRLRGDGPASWTVWLTAARPRTPEFASWGALPGAYIGKGAVCGAPIRSVKKIEIMRTIVRDYSREGDLVLDPCAGTGTTIAAAVAEGRSAIGTEVEHSTWAYAVERLRSDQ